jgi:hypothetical protein
MMGTGVNANAVAVAAVPPTTDAPDDPNSPAAIKLGEQLDAVERTIRELSEAHGCYADIEGQIAAARTQIAIGKLADAQSSYEKASVAAWRAKSSADAEPVAWQLLAVQVACLILILGLGYFVKRYPSYWLWADIVGNSAKAAWFGALGGVTIGMYGLYTHISTKDFDRSFKLWYLCKPVMGAIFGWFVYLVYYVGVISAQGTAGKAEIANPELAFLIAFLAGFSERFTIKTIDRFMTVLTVGEDPKKTAAANKAKQDSLVPQ